MQFWHSSNTNQLSKSCLINMWGKRAETSSNHQRNVLHIWAFDDKQRISPVIQLAWDVPFPLEQAETRTPNQTSRKENSCEAARANNFSIERSGHGADNWRRFDAMLQSDRSSDKQNSDCQENVQSWFVSDFWRCLRKDKRKAKRWRNRSNVRHFW